MGKIISGITSLLLLGGIGIALWYFLGKPENLSEAKDGLGDAYNKTKDQIDKFDFGDVLEDLGDLDWGQFFNDDPFAGNTTVTLWNEQFIERDDGGLQLTLVNSLSADWQEEFEVAVADWSMSDALTLDVVVEPVDDAWDNEKKCKRQDDKMVVCNGNFGDTGWVGIVSYLLYGLYFIYCTIPCVDHYV